MFQPYALLCHVAGTCSDVFRLDHDINFNVEPELELSYIVRCPTQDRCNCVHVNKFFFPRTFKIYLRFLLSLTSENELLTVNFAAFHMKDELKLYLEF